MGKHAGLRVFRLLGSRRSPPRLSPELSGVRPRSYVEWKALRRWGRLPDWELDPPGYLLRLARQEAGLTQDALARELGCSQQAVAQAERWRSNATVDFMRRWARACGRRLEVRLLPVSRGGLRPRKASTERE
jgi:DNA-binding XRE family transcriptional regulator